MYNIFCANFVIKIHKVKRIMHLKISKIIKGEDVDKTFKSEEATSVSRRDFFKRTASVSAVAAVSILAPGALFADDINIMEHTKWGTTLGDE
jgi:hypothetical protein